MASSVPRFWSPRDGFPPTRLFIRAITGLTLVACLGCATGGADEQTRSLGVHLPAADSPAADSPATGGTNRPLAATTSTTLQASTIPPVSIGSNNSNDDSDTGSTTSVPASNGPRPSAPPTSGDAAAADAAPDGGTRPGWLGRRPLPTVPDGRVVVPQTTPGELRNRRFPTIDTLPPPPDDRFVSRIGPVPDDVLSRSTWVEGCPVAVGDLRYLTLAFWGFDGTPHTGEMIVNAKVADDIVSVFRALHEARFPMEEMRVVSPTDLAAEPTGDGNNTTAFVCRPVTGGTAFSQHAYGLAIDVNPFHNPYVRGDLLLPELSAHYLDRADAGPGAIAPGDVAVRAFAEIGWGWGGGWTSLKDYQHFSLENR